MDTEDDIHVLAAYLLGGKREPDSRKASIAVGPEGIELGAPASERGSGPGETDVSSMQVVYIYIYIYNNMSSMRIVYAKVCK